MHHPTDRITHTTAFVTPVMEHWLEREIAQWIHHEGSIRPPHRTMSERSYDSYISLPSEVECLLMVSWVIGLIPYFSFQPLFNYCRKQWYVLSCWWDSAYKIFLAAN